jgi:hypothetical protein
MVACKKLRTDAGSAPSRHRVARASIAAGVVLVNIFLVQVANLAVHGGKNGPHPTDRRKAGSKYHLITDADGVPLAATVTSANAHDD